MTPQREDLVKLAREALSKCGQHTYSVDATRYEPPDWLVDAMTRAYKRGFADGTRAGTGFYPEGG